MKYSSFVSGYPHKKRKSSDRFMTRLVTITAAISICLITFGVTLASRIPRDDFFRILTTGTITENKDVSISIYPQPTDDIRTKANRLREIRMEEYEERRYTPLPGEMDNVYVEDYDKICYLTFDDGPSAVTPVILDVLEKYKVKATFFVTGNRAEANPNIMKSIADGGHTIGNHTHTHVYDSVYDGVSGFKNEVLLCKEAIDTALGYEYHNLVFRFPGGYDSLTDESSKADYRSALEEMGYKYIDWNCLTGDSNTTEPTEEYLMNTLKSGISSSGEGDIVVLMHDAPGKDITAKTLPKIIEYLYEEGYEFRNLENK